MLIPTLSTSLGIQCGSLSLNTDLTSVVFTICNTKVCKKVFIIFEDTVFLKNDLSNCYKAIFTTISENTLIQWISHGGCFFVYIVKIILRVGVDP